MDALCINQTSDVEKSWQVKMMDQIYSRAANTFVYLGPPTRESYEAMRTFSAYGRKALKYGILSLSSGPSPTDPFEFGYERWTLGPADSYGRKIITQVVHDMHDPSKLSPLTMLASIMQRPWWSRIWVLQELLLSPNPIFICGDQTISAREFVASVRLYEAALTVYYEHLLSNSDDSSKHDYDLSLVYKVGHETRNLHSMADAPALVLYTTQLRQRERSKYHSIEEPYFGLGNLWDLVQDITLSSQRLDASDPRDRIYALIGIARLSRVDTLTIQPDYALTCADVYAQATYHFMQYTGARMLVLAAKNQKRTTVPYLPSWAVDWSLTDLLKTPFPDSENRPLDLFSFVRDASKKNILTASATVYGRIDTIEPEVSAIGTETTNGQDLDVVACMSQYQWLLTMYKHIASKDLKYSLEEDLIRAMVLYSASSNSTIDTAESTPSELDGAIASVRNEVRRLPRPVMQEEDTKDYTTTDSIKAGTNLAIASSIDSKILTSETDGSGSTADALSYVLDRIRDTIQEGAKVFIAGDGLLGIGLQETCKGDMVVRFDNEALMFVVRPLEGGVYELIGRACVPQLDNQRASAIKTLATTIKLC